MLLQTRPDVTKIRIDKVDLIDSVARTKMTARIDTYLLRLSVQNDTLGVSSEDLMFSKKSKEVCSSEVEGPSGFDIGVNGDNFLDCLNAVESDTVEIEMDGPKKAIYIYDDDAPNKRILCMPLLLVS
jgi:DNA polymerase III sliding clamp (beta) subunit (PCNA family)